MVPIHSSISVVVTTTDSSDHAHQLAHSAVQSSLAACAQILPIRSVYHWNGQIQSSTESRIEFKTMPELVDSLQDHIQKHHTYELPEIGSFQMIVSIDYFHWVKNSVMPQT